MKFDLEGIFFDFGGTLFDYHPPNAVIWSRIAKRLGVDISPDDPRVIQGVEDQLKAYVDCEKTFSKLTPEELHSFNSVVLNGLGIDPNGTQDIIFEEFEKRRDGFKIVPECKTTLEQIHRKGIKIGLISNSDVKHSLTRRSTMGEGGILHFFNPIILSSEVGYDKPQREIFELALTEMGVHDRSKVMHVGDDPISDVIGAENAELIPVLIEHKYTPPNKNLIKIKKLSDILKYLS